MPAVPLAGGLACEAPGSANALAAKPESKSNAAQEIRLALKLFVFITVPPDTTD